MMGIKKKFLFLTGVVGVLLALVSALGYFMAYRALDASIQDEISASMEAERQKLSGWVAEHTRIAEDLAAHAAAMDEAVGKPTPGMIKLAKDDMILDITLGREDDYAIGAKDGNLTGEFFPTSRDWYKDAKAQGKTIYTDPYIDDTTTLLSFKESYTTKNDDGVEKDLTKEPFTVLLSGENQGLADAIILISVNPVSMRITMTSIARDSYVPITCYGGRSNKINAAHASSESCLVNTVEKLTGIDIDYTVEFNFKSVIQVVDALDILVVRAGHQHHLGVHIGRGEAVLLGTILGVAHAVAGDVKPAGVHARQYGVPVGLLELRLHAQAVGDQRADLDVQAGQHVVLIVIGPGRPVALGGNDEGAALLDPRQQVPLLRHGGDGSDQQQRQQQCDQFLHGISSFDSAYGCVQLMRAHLYEANPSYHIIPSKSITFTQILEKKKL